MFDEKLNVKEKNRDKSKHISMAPVCSSKHLHHFLHHSFKMLGPDNKMERKGLKLMSSEKEVWITEFV